MNIQEIYRLMEEARTDGAKVIPLLYAVTEILPELLALWAVSQQLDGCRPNSRGLLAIGDFYKALKALDTKAERICRYEQTDSKRLGATPQRQTIPQ